MHITLSPSKLLDEIQPNLSLNYSHQQGMQLHMFCPARWGHGEGSKGQKPLENPLLTCIGRATAHFYPAHWAPGEVSKGQISLKNNFRVSFKDF